VQEFITVGTAEIRISQWVKFKTIKTLTKALKDKGMTLDPQAVWEALQPFKN